MDHDPKRLRDIMADAAPPELELAFRPMFGGEWRHGLRLVEPDPGVELVGERRLGVMTPALGLGAVDDADEALEPRRHQRLLQRRLGDAVAQV